MTSYKKISNINYIISYNNTKTNNCQINFFSCSQICKDCIYYLNKILCIEECSDEEYVNENNECIKIPNGKYYNSTLSQIDSCYISCEKCSKSGNETNHNCNECKKNYYPIKDSKYPFNCYQNLIGYVFDPESNIFKKCPNNCVVCEIDYDEDEVEIECEICIEGYKEKDDKCVIDISNKSLSEIFDNLNNDILTYDTNVELEGKNFSMEVINSTQNYTVKVNLCVVNLSQCENILKKKYNLKQNESLLIAKFDINDTKKIKLNGEVIYKIYDSNGTELNLQYCSNSSILIEYVIKNSTYVNITYPEIMNGKKIDIFNPKDNYFNYICITTIGVNGDLTIKERKIKQYNNITCGDKKFFIKESIIL